jgi:hypothetical protein
MAESEVKMKEKNAMAELISWEAYIKVMEQRIAETKEEIKELTTAEREMMKEYRTNLKAAKWMVGKVLVDMKTNAVKHGEVSGKITLDDFDVDNANIDIDLVKQEMKNAGKDNYDEEE